MDADDPAPFCPVIGRAEGAPSVRSDTALKEAAMILRIRAASRGVPLHQIVDEVIGPPAAWEDPNIAGTC